ncbi:hypothetical protein CUJ83_13040 [Methanocella sp. CWC-04]|uniref:Uncharacterized protein n=1 Tax=Methanooceanicella nereidis TaxID=2052831 RepID=A0AAP2RE00_9EURY|nr:hypothetical protein [Methanocella sp. CWC-04]MCD1295921.1 hypothetical protein [Methanocella sp. CWC-04]
MNYKSLLALLSVLMLVAISGCTESEQGPSPAASSTPEPTISTTPVPSQGPISIGVIKSNQVSVADVKVAYNRGKELQAEDFSILLVNNGNTPARNTAISLKISDAQTAQYYFGDQFQVGEIPPNSSKWVNLTTISHDYTFSIMVDMDVYWGDNLEFKNSYKKAMSLAFVPWT